MFDSHCHLNTEIHTSPKEAIKSLYQEAIGSGINNIILLNIPDPIFQGKDGFSNEDVINCSKKYNDFFYVFPSLNPNFPKAINQLKYYKNLGAKGIKLHPRLHNYHIEKKECIDIVKKAGYMKLPVMICYFPDGINLKLGNTAVSIGRLADHAPDTKIAIGHAGGHKILDHLMIIKSCKNLYLDLSFTLLYYRGSSVINDIEYSIKNIKAQRILWGTDYPDRPYAESVEASLSVFEKMKIDFNLKHRILNENCYDFLTN